MMRKTLRRLMMAALGAALLGSGLTGCLFPGTNHAPIASFSALPREGYQALTVAFDASGSFDPDGDSIVYHWDFGDGETGNGLEAEHTYVQAGAYTAILQVEDNRGLSDTTTTTITVREIPEGYRVVHLEWARDGQLRKWDALIPESLYQEYRARPRIPYVNTHTYGDYVTDPKDDPTFEDLAAVLMNRVNQDEDEFILETLALVQGAIDYAADPNGTDYPLYPLETLVDGEGDCEDTAILFVSLLRAQGVACRLAFVDTDGDSIPDHVLVLVAVSNELLSELSCAGGVAMFSWDNQPFVVAETAVDHGVYALGCDPWGLEEDDLIEMWSF